MRFIGFVPAKGTSMAIKEKNLQFIGGFSLLDWSLKFAIEQELLSTLIVSTESSALVEGNSRLKSSLKDFNKACANSLVGVDSRIHIHKRDNAQASASAKTSDLLVDICKNSSFADEDIIVTLQPTTPFRSKEEFVAMSESFSRRDSINSLFTAVEFDSPNPGKAILLDSSGNIDSSRTILNNLDRPRQELDKYLVSDGHYYFTKVSQIRSAGKLIVGDSRVWIRYPRYQVNIDNISDLDFARFIFQTKKDELHWIPTS